METETSPARERTSAPLNEQTVDLRSDGFVTVGASGPMAYVHWSMGGGFFFGRCSLSELVELHSRIGDVLERAAQ